MTVHPDQIDPKCKINHMTCRACVQIQLYFDGIYASIDTQILKTPHIHLFHLAALDNVRNPDIVHSRYVGEISFKNSAPKYLKQNSYNVSTKYYFKL